MYRPVVNYQKTFSIVCFGDHWDEYFRRRQQIMIKMSNYEVFDKIVYVELPLNIFSFFKFLLGKSLPKVAQAWRRILQHGPLYKDNRVWILTPITLLPYIPIKIIREINNFITYRLELLVLKFSIRKLRLRDSILWATHPFAADFIGKLGENMVCYDKTEDFAYKHDWNSMLQRHMEKNDAKIIEKADLIFVQTKEILEKISAVKKNVFLVPNGVDISWFVNNTEKETININNISHPILGYSGNSSSRLDFELLKYILMRHPDWSLVLIGQLVPGADEFSLVKDLKNIHFLGIKTYEELPLYLKKFDVCLIPHKIDKFTESQSPLKLFDYLAAGKPIVSTNIAGVRDFKNIVRIGHTKEDFVSLLEEVLTNDSKEEIEKRQAIASQNSWEKRVEEVYKILKLQVINL